MLLQYMAAEKNSDYLTYRVAEWLSTLPEPARVALGFTYGMGEWLIKWPSSQLAQFQQP